MRPRNARHSERSFEPIDQKAQYEIDRWHCIMNQQHAKAGSPEPTVNRPDTLMLDRDRFATLRGASQIRVTHGSLWLTVDGEPDDVFIECGQGVALPAGVRVLVQAVHAPARAVVLRPAGWRERLRAAWQSLVHRPAGAHS
jgi:Protein of unknown function (DUF2917)